MSRLAGIAIAKASFVIILTLETCSLGGSAYVASLFFFFISGQKPHVWRLYVSLICILLTQADKNKPQVKAPCTIQACSPALVFELLALPDLTHWLTSFLVSG